MANDPYNSGVPSVTPDVHMPDDYQHIDARPEAFGALIGQGLQQFGQGAVKLRQFWGEIQRDSVMNDFLKENNARVEHFKGLQGQDALDAQKTINDDIQKSADAYRARLQLPEQKDFDEQTRPYIDRYWAGQITSHSTQQAHAFGTITNTNGLTEAANRALQPQVYGNEDELKHAFGDAQRFAHKQLVLDGQDRDQASIAAANLRASQAVYGGAALSMAANGNPNGALEFAKRHQDELGPDFAKIETHLQEKGDQATGMIAAKEEIAKAAAGFQRPKQAEAVAGAPAPNGDISGAQEARSYLSGLSMHQSRQGDTSNIHPEFAVRLAGAIKEARANGLEVGMLSGYRSANETGSAYDSGGLSFHDKGAAADVSGIGAAGSAQAQQWAAIAAKHGLFNPYGVDNPREWNHWQLVPDKLENRPDMQAAIKAAGGDQAKIWDAIKPVGSASGATATTSMEALQRAFIGQEGGKNVVSINGARGPTQIMPETFAQYAKPGESIDNPADNIAVNKRILADYAQKYNGDPARIAVAYFSGPGNVAPSGSATPWLKDTHDGNGKFVSQYVADIQTRLGGGAPGRFTAPSGQPLAAAAAGQPIMHNGVQLPPVDPYVAPPPVAPPSPAPAPAEPPSPEQIKASAYQAIRERDDLTDAQKRHAYSAINQQITEQQIMEQATAKAKKDRSEKASDTYIKQFLSGNVAPDIMQRITNDPNLEPATRLHLGGIAEKYTTNGQAEINSYGKGFWDVVKGASAPPGDPGRITDVDQIWRRAMPGGDLTLAGAEKAISIVKQSAKDVDQAHLNASLTSVIGGFKKTLSFDDEQLYPGMPPIKYPAGEFAFHSQFVPRILGEYDKWVADGKNPWDFIKDTKHFAEVAEQILPAKKVAMDKLAAGAALAGEAPPGNSTQKPAIPPPPQNVDPGNWQQVMDERPSTASGKKWNAGRWATYLDAVKTNPTKENLEEFKAKTGLEPEDVFKKIEPDNRSLFEKARAAGRSISHVLKGD